ncbi:MAG: hypothetical protein WC628_07385 [Candidatus Omnitrophota bacterium]
MDKAVMDKQAQKNYLALKKFARQQGLDLFGVADISEMKKEFLLAPRVLVKLSRAVCIGARAAQGVLEEIESAPTRLYFYHYKTLNFFLDQASLRLGNYIQNKGYLAIPIPATQIVDWKTQSAHLSHKKIGVTAGLGWIGRNNLLVNKEFGAQFRLATVLTDMPLTADQPLKEDCGACVLCLASCPAQAIKENPADFQRQHCFEKLKDFNKQRLVDQYICGACVNACAPKAKERL